MRHIIFALLTILLAVMPDISRAQDTTKPRQHAVLVTGASSGIGLKITERLARNGYFVYAGARKQADLDALDAIDNVQGIRLDVTKQDEIDAAVATVTKAGRGLYGLVNNAGIATLGPLISMPKAEFDRVMAVNADGPFLVTRAFAPLILASKGRIVNIGSISGILNDPDAGAYQMTKHAIETFTDTLAQELAPSGVKVSVVEPGGFKSEIYKNLVERANIGQKEAAQWETLPEPDAVAEATEQALFAPNPKRRYMVVPNQEQAEMTINAQLLQLVQLNEDQPYTYDRTTLIRMLDEALKQVRPHTGH
jgi:NAD(P)-dependent dehydrogenase (short-subunit alcohol dehydrogenase family)